VIETDLINRSVIAKDWHAQGFSCGLWIDHSGREWTCHPSQADELFMIMSGELELEMEGQTIQPSIGEEIRIPAGVSHTIRNPGGKTARWLYGQKREAPPLEQNTVMFQERSQTYEGRRKRVSIRREPVVEAPKGA
jgi:cupin 2 domain-containing protein